jgi:hypothetical protein
MAPTNEITKAIVDLKISSINARIINLQCKAHLDALTETLITLSGHPQARNLFAANIESELHKISTKIAQHRADVQLLQKVVQITEPPSLAGLPN